MVNQHPTFLAYASRSGSTFLATQLSRRYDITVVPEFRSAYALLTLPAGVPVNPEVARSLLDADPQLTWTTAEQVLSSLGHAPTPPAVIEAVGRAAGDAGKPLLFKLGGTVHIWELVRAHFPDARAICVVRDGRAVANSLMRSDAPYLKGSAMGYGDILRIARTWSNDVTVQCRVATARPMEVRLLRYEDLLSDITAMTADLAAFNEWNETTTPTAGFRVAPQEAAIHRLVGSAPSASRIDAWRSELAAADRLVVETVAADVLAASGYSGLLDVDERTRQRILARARQRHRAVTIKYAARRAMRVRSAASLRAALRLRQARAAHSSNLS